MRIEFQNTAEDYIEVYRPQLRNYRRRSYGWIAAGLALVLVTFLDASATGNTTYWPLAGFGLVIIFANVAWSGKRWARDMFQRHQHRPETFVTEIDEHGIRIRSPTASHDFKWNHFDRLQETENNFALFNGAVFYMFPKKAFPEGGVKQFRVWAQERISSSASASGAANT